MRRKGLLGLAAAAILISGCGGDDEADSSATEQEAQDVVATHIAAFQDGDFELVCETLDERGNESIITISKQDTCAEGYEELFSRQRAFGGVAGKPFDDFVDQLGDYEVGPATVPGAADFAAEVSLEGPIEGVKSFLVEEDGELKVSELFVTPDAATSPESGLSP